MCYDGQGSHVERTIAAEQSNPKGFRQRKMSQDMGLLPVDKIVSSQTYGPP